MHPQKLLLLLVATALGGLCACGGSSPSNSDAGPDAGPPATDGGVDAGTIADGGPIAVQMNDVSILYPIANDQGASSVDLIPLSASGARGVLLPSTLYDSIGHISGTTFNGPPAPGGVGEAQYKNLYVVALRIDPCFAALAPDPHGAGCLNQLRLIAQEVDVEGGHLEAFDSAMHLFYSLTRAELEQLALDLLRLREASRGDLRLGALAPHPIMAQEGLNGAYATGLRALILQYAGAQNLTRVTQLESNNNFRWAFQGFDVTNAATQASATVMIIPTLPTNTSAQAFQRNFGPNANMQGSFSPETTDPNDLALLVNQMNASAATAQQRQAAFTALVKVENPGDFTANTIDCGSCHLAMPAEQFNAEPAFGFSETGNGSAFVANGNFCLADELKATLDSNGPFNLHAFSYVGSSAAINQRVVNETAAVVAYLNTLE